MSRRWFVLMSGLLSSALLVATAWGQASRQTPSLAERMAAMRRGWSQGATRPSEQSGGKSPATSANDAEYAADEESASMFHNFFGRRDAQPESPTSGRTPPQATQRAGSVTQSTRAVSPSRAGTTGSTQSAAPKSEGFTLPGLGGSPLPNTRNAATAKTPGGPDVSREFTDDYPVIRGERANAAPGGVATRPNTSAATSRAGANSSARQSPPRRSVPHVDPEQLRRELAGSYPTSSNRSATAPRTARAPAAVNAARSADKYAPQTAGSSGGSSPEPDLAADENLEPELADTTDESSAANAARAFGETGDLGSAFGASEPPRTPRRNSPTIARPSTRSQQAFTEFGATNSGQTPRPAEPASNDPAVLVSSQTPVITTNIRGPKQILVGREATYRVQLRNQSDTAADGIVVTIRIPAWAEVVDTSTTQGMIQQSRGVSQSGDLQWQLTQLQARGSETLDIRLIPRAPRPLELGVSWTLTPVGSRAVVEVQEPKLQINVAGPDEVLFSEPQLFRLTLANPGTGVAENVKIELMPPGGGKQAATSHPIGDLPPGASRTVEVELTAREAGKLFVKAVARAEGGLTCDAAKEIFCRKPELEVDWRGPETKYAGTQATYFFRVRNPGTAPAENVTVNVKLPEGAEFTSASDGQSYDAKQRQIEWRIGTLGPGDDNYMELKCVVNSPGANQFNVTAGSTSADLSATKLAETNVVALADLKLDVSDPSGPVAVGEQAVYEIRVQNRGANTAKEVNVVALFSQGIEPDQVEGAMYTVVDGRVTFRTIDELPAGRDVVLRIRAHALQAGTHVFRAEVLCRDLDIKLAAEETTRFYADDAQPDATNAADQPAADFTRPSAPGSAGG